MKRIAMWSGPRNISTAMMRSFENREDTFVIDEPFYAFYLSHSGFNHPGKEEVLKSQSTNWDEVVKLITGDIPDNKFIWYQKLMVHQYCFESVSYTHLRAQETGRNLVLRLNQ